MELPQIYLDLYLMVNPSFYEKLGFEVIRDPNHL